MRYALISDIHANLEAFEAVLKDIREFGADNILFLGDVIGYGPSPNECMELLLKVADVFLGGNHDWAVVGKTSDDYFNPFAKAAVDWTREVLKDDYADFLRRTRPNDIFDELQLTHSSPCNPSEWRYILSQKEALDNLPCMEKQLCFIGHSHQPLVVEFQGDKILKVNREESVALEVDKKYIINVGSVGQPRDFNVNACWVLYDSEEGIVFFRRVAYDILVTQKKMIAAGLPNYLIERLAAGR